ncbi:hypothetical protein [Bradyrhizobium algeriense]|uniref:hypothetical protein n=1 Tax=Bradyrhizobium algeriense TaxID=634784 RepID=UPI00167F0F41|nr:hypothetical protein [Bradyrhizobium algeriense]
MANEKGPNIKKKQKCKNCEGKGPAEEGRQGRKMPALQGDRRAVNAARPPRRVARGRCG